MNYKDQITAEAKLHMAKKTVKPKTVKVKSPVDQEYIARRIKAEEDAWLAEAVAGLEDYDLND